MINTALSGNRWDNYFLRHGESFYSFWKEFLASAGTRDILFIIGQGFDPRMTLGAAAILSCGGSGRRDCVLIQFDEGSASPSRAHDNIQAENIETINKAFSNTGSLKPRPIEMWSNDGRRRTGSRNIASVVKSSADLVGYSDIIVDISAMPRTLYMPLIAKVLYLLDKWEQKSGMPNLHVIVSEDPDFDQSITGQGLDDDASYVHGFSGEIQLEATANVPRVWMPILGEGKGNHFERICDLVNPDEVVPILPFPCLNPRRTDKLFIEYRADLMDRLRVEPRNFLYVPEQNPFGVYRQVTSAVQHYAEALYPLGGCKFVFSALSSKLISLGCLLAAYELKKSNLAVGIAHVNSSGYAMTNKMPKETDLFEVWLAGDSYAQV